METNEIPTQSPVSATSTPKEAKRRKFSKHSLVRKDDRWHVLGLTLEVWIFAFLVALALPYINIVAIPVMFFVFAGALAIYSVWALLSVD